MADGRKKEPVREHQECSGRGVSDYVCKGQTGTWVMQV